VRARRPCLIIGSTDSGSGKEQYQRFGAFGGAIMEGGSPSLLAGWSRVLALLFAVFK
jgi:hypothetical protein